MGHKDMRAGITNPSDTSSDSEKEHEQDKKHKHRSHKHKDKRAATSSDSSDATSSSDSENERRKEKKRKHRSKKHKKDKHSKKHKKDSEKELVKAAKKFLKKQKHGAVAAPPPPPELEPNPDAVPHHIGSTDYFLKHSEFSSWLLEYKQRYFNEMSADDSRALFEEFVEVWNTGRLPGKYYSGLMAAPVARTTYQWSFAGQAPDRGKGAVGMGAFLDDSNDRRVHLRQEFKEDQKRWRAEQKEVLDELLPKATGREALLEKKAARRDATRARDESPDAVRLPGGGTDVLGGGDSFAEAKAREAKRHEVRHHRAVARVEEVQHRVQQHRAQEEAKMAQFKALLAQGPITIPKRQ